MFETPQAKVAGGFLALQTVIVLVILIIIGVFFSNVLKTLGGSSGEGTRTIVWALVVPYVLLIISNLLTVFDVNCTVAGNCNIWAWVKTIFIVLGAISSVVMLITVLVNLSKITKTVTTKEKQEKKVEEFKDYVA